MQFFNRVLTAGLFVSALASTSASANHKDAYA